MWKMIEIDSVAFILVCIRAAFSTVNKQFFREI